METSPTKNNPQQGQEISGSFLIRMINQTIDRIRKDAAFIVLPSREATVTAAVSSHIQQAGIPLENDEPDANSVENDNPDSFRAERPPFTHAEIKSSLDAILVLTVVEKVLFADDLQRLSRKNQEEFLALLKQCT